ncbi:alpha/beta hydrolase family protein [Micromonospora zhanjiangensis]|uniref:Alpha/beta hydrolase family protein n=1 Tax=Micromonospora zhanjiangensis TaxID=1522057 RepID=A0ABV8KLL3_9ACTN
MRGLLGLLVAAVLSGCGQPVVASTPVTRVSTAQEGTYAVGVRTLRLARGPGRPLPTTVWYPVNRAASNGRTVQNAPIAAGRFPLVLFSHGLHSLPEMHGQLTSRWAAAGFVVAAPAYPHTNRRAGQFSRADIRNQPADAWQVVQQVLRLNDVPSDPFAGHLDPTRLAAAGHSAGGYTTAGLFSAGHAAQLRAGIVIAGAGMTGSSFGGPTAKMLFVHGNADGTVPISRGRAAFNQVPWPKAFLTVTRGDHGGYLAPGRRAFDQIVRTMTDFLRWALYGDLTARRRLPTDASSPGTTEFDSRL